MQVLSSGVQTRWKAVFRLNESREQTAGAIKLRKCGAYASGLKVRCEVRSFEARGSRLGKVKKGVLFVNCSKSSSSRPQSTTRRWDAIALQKTGQGVTRSCAWLHSHPESFTAHKTVLPGVLFLENALTTPSQLLGLGCSQQSSPLTVGASGRPAPLQFHLLSTSSAHGLLSSALLAQGIDPSPLLLSGPLLAGDPPMRNRPCLSAEAA